MSKVDAYLLDTAAVGGAEPVVFPGFPGTWAPGRPVGIQALASTAGVDPAELVDLAEGLGLPLKHVKADAADATVPVPDNHAVGAASGDPQTSPPPTRHRSSPERRSTTRTAVLRRPRKAAEPVAAEPEAAEEPGGGGE